MKVGDLVKYASNDSPLGLFRRSGGIVTAQNNNLFGTIVYWFRDKQLTEEQEKYLVVISESR
jgi:hypothetical protein|tara:strand:+ start:1265 stop:1450 length:186 start_codon:yes stop_codon:yes gene_type:complete